MQEPELSVIIPVMNIENRICDVLNTLKEDTKGFSVEFLIIDRGSKDKTMQMALRFLRQNQLNGYVMQESGGNISQTLMRVFKDRKSTRLNSSHRSQSRMPSSA